MGLVIGVGTNDRLTSHLVRHVTASWCSHTWLECSILSPAVIHATPEGVKRDLVEDIWKKYPVHRRYWLVKADDADVLDGVHLGLQLLGTPYDWGVVGNGFALWRWRRTGRIGRVRRNPRELHCSELVSLVLRQIGVAKSDQLDPEMTTPGKLDAFMNGHHQFEVLR